MDKRYLQKESLNSATRHWSEVNQRVQGNSLPSERIVDGYTYVSLQQNDLWELQQIWEQWDVRLQNLFTGRYGDIAQLIYVRINQSLLRATFRFWNPAYCCFTFNGQDLMPTTEEYTALINQKTVHRDWIYSKPPKKHNYELRLKNFAGMSDEWGKGLIRIRGDSMAFAWENIREIIPTHPDEVLKMDLFALAIYGLIIFPRVLGNIDIALLDLFDRLKQKANPVPAILAETFMSLNASRRHEESRFRGCAQLLQVWIQSHLWKTPRGVLQGFSFQNFSPLREYLTQKWREDISRKKWAHILRNINAEDIVWRVPWMGRSNNFLFSCGDYNWLMLLGLYGGIGCAPLLVSRQFDSRQFIPVTAGLSQTEFFFKGEYRAKVQTIMRAWDHCFRIQTEGSSTHLTTPDYDLWVRLRVNNELPQPDEGPTLSLEEHMKIVPSEAEILRSELEEVKQKIEVLNTRHAEELFKVNLDVDERDGTIKHLQKVNIELSEKNTLYQQDVVKLQNKVNNASRRKFLAMEKERIKYEQMMEEEGKRSQQALEQERENYHLALENERRASRDTLRREKEKAKHEIEKGKQAVVCERENTDAWKRRSVGSRNRLLEMQDLYNDTIQNLDQSQARNAELGGKLMELEQVLQSYQQRNGFIELRERELEVHDLRARILTLEATVQDYQERLLVFEESVTGGDRYWQIRLQNAAQMITSRDLRHTTLITEVQKVARNMLELGTEAEALRQFVAPDMPEAPRFYKLLRAIDKLGARASFYV